MRSEYTLEKAPATKNKQLPLAPLPRNKERGYARKRREAAYFRKGIPIALSKANASSSVLAVVQKVISIPRKRST